jgi:hypothetical protein
MPTVKVGTRVRVVWGLKPQPGVVTEVFKVRPEFRVGEDTATHYMVRLDNGRKLSTTVDSLILEPD